MEIPEVLADAPEDMEGDSDSDTRRRRGGRSRSAAALEAAPSVDRGEEKSLDAILAAAEREKARKR